MELPFNDLLLHRLTLTVLETCVKNCGKKFHVLVATKEFIQELVKLIGPKYDPPTAVQEKVLSLIQLWAETFSSQPDLKGVVEVYQELKNKGIEFPAVDPDNIVPIYTPQKVSILHIQREFLIHFYVIRALQLHHRDNHQHSKDHLIILQSLTLQCTYRVHQVLLAMVELQQSK